MFANNLETVVWTKAVIKCVEMPWRLASQQGGSCRPGEEGQWLKQVGSGESEAGTWALPQIPGPMQGVSPDEF